jgi:OPA family glycerol-3-phosphate transporter-like MFS transporter
LAALLLAGFSWWTLRDTPQSCGLPPIDEYRNDFSGKKSAKGEELSIPFKRLFIDYIFKNRVLWLIAFANVCVYLVRYGISDWAPTYLQELNIMDATQSNLAFSLHNYAGVPGTIICGWISARFFKGRCAPANVLYMALVLVGILVYWQAAPIAEWIAQVFGGSPEAVCRAVVYTSLCEIGFCIYGPVALIGVQALNLVPKNAAGTAAGFVGLFGYLIGDALLAKIIMGKLADSSYGWNGTFWMFCIASLIAIVFCATTWKKERKELQLAR